MKYSKGYKYQTREKFVLQTEIYPDSYIRTRFISLSKRGRLSIRAGYAWDGSSGPTIQSKKTKTPSLAHDSLYQLMRMGLLSQKWRVPADRLLQSMLIERGMWRIRAWWWYRGLQVAGGSSALPENKKIIYTAP